MLQGELKPNLPYPNHSLSTASSPYSLPPPRRNLPFLTFSVRPSSCSDYIDFNNCATKALRSHCDSQEAEEFFKEIMDKVFGEVLNLTCGKFSNEPSLCDALPKLSTEDDKEALRRHFIDAIAVISGSLG